MKTLITLFVLSSLIALTLVAFRIAGRIDYELLAPPQPPQPLQLLQPLVIEQLSPQSVKNIKSIKVYVTQYSTRDSCHNQNSKGECLMASGRVVYEGAAACPTNLKLGTKIKIDDKEYICEDRYAKWVDSIRDYPTIDQFVFSNPKGKELKTVYY